MDAARSISRWVISLSGFRGGPPNRPANLSFVILRPVQ